MRSCPTIACEPQTYFRSTLLRFAGRRSTNMCWFSGPGTRDEPLRTSAWEATSQLTSFCLSGLTEKPSIVPPIFGKFFLCDLMTSSRQKAIYFEEKIDKLWNMFVKQFIASFMVEFNEVYLPHAQLYGCKTQVWLHLQEKRQYRAIIWRKQTTL